MVKKIILAISGLLLCTSLLAQVTGGVKGTVVNRADRTPVQGASLTLFSGAELVAQAVSEKDGTFFIEGLPDGMYSLVITGDEFIGMTSDGKKTLDFKLIGKAIAVAAITACVGGAYLRVQSDILGTDFNCVFSSSEIIVT